MQMRFTVPDSPESAAREIAFFFTASEIIDRA